MACPVVRKTGRGGNSWGPSGRPHGDPASGPLRPHRLTSDTGMRSVSTASSGESGGVADLYDEAHPVNPGEGAD